MINTQIAHVVFLNKRILTLQKWSKSVGCALSYSLLKIFSHQSSWKADCLALASTNLSVTKLRIYTTQCAFDEFASFLKRWISLIKGYNFAAFIFYHVTGLESVLVRFNCTTFGDWTLSGTRIVIFRSLFTNLSATKLYIYTSQCASDEFASFLKCWISLIN